MSNILYKDECFAIQGAIFEVYRNMGTGFLEAVYQECLEKEFQTRGILFKAQTELPLLYKGEPLRQKYIPDFVCYEKIIVELKAVKTVADEHKAQIINYLHATHFQLGLLVNFSAYPGVYIERILNTTLSNFSCISDAKNEFTTTQN
jgi:GxxExxY protein